jgi:pilus assembly protein CpaC
MKKFMSVLLTFIILTSTLAVAETPNMLLIPEPAKAAAVAETVNKLVEPEPAKADNVFYQAVGTSKLIKLDFDVKNLAVGNPAVADVLIMSKREILINGKTAGVTSLTLWDAGSHHDYYLVINKSSENTYFKSYKLHNIPLVHYKMEDPDKMILVTSEPIKDTIEDLKNILSAYLDTNQFSVSPWMNSIMVVATAEGHKSVEDLMAKIDIKDKQVLFKVEVYELKLDNGVGYTLDLLYQKDQITGQYNKKGDGFMYTFNSGADYVEAAEHVLKVMLTEGKAKVLANPKVLTLNGRYSFIHAGEKIPLVQTDNQGNKTVEYLYTGVILGVVPNVDKDGDINCWVSTQVSSISGYDPQNQYPFIGTRETVSEVRIKNNGLLVLGGLLKEEETIKTHKIPIVGDLLGWIPILGNIVKNEETSKTNTELLITLRPIVLFADENVAEVPQ